MSSQSLKTKLQNLQITLEQLRKNECDKITFSVMNTHYMSLEEVIVNLPVLLLSEEVFRVFCVCCTEYIDCIYILATKLNPYRYLKNSNTIQRYLNILTSTTELLKDLSIDFIEYLAPAVFLKLDSMEPPWFFKILMKTFKQCLQHTSRKKRHKIFIDNLTEFLKLADIICRCGDFSYQATLIEIIFRVGSSEQIKQYAGDFFPNSNELKDALLNVRLDNFDLHLRAFQNSINKKFKSIFSIKCALVLLDDITVTKPSEDVDMWVDFNIGFKSISFFCNRDCSDSFDRNQEVGWETVTVMVDSVSSVISSSWKSNDQMSVMGKIICFVLEKPCICVYSSYQTQKYLRLFVLEGPELKELELKVLPEMFGNKCNNVKNLEDFNTKMVYRILNQQLISKSSTNDAFDDQLNNGNISRSYSRPSLSTYSSPHSSIFSDSDSLDKFQNLSSRAVTNTYCNKYSRKKIILLPQSTEESAQFGYESSVSEDLSLTEDFLVNTETFIAKGKTTMLANNLDDRLKNNTSKISGNLSQLKCSTIINNIQNSREDDTLLSKSKDSKNKSLKPILTFKTKREEPVERVSVHESILPNEESRISVSTSNSSISDENISKSKNSVDEEKCIKQYKNTKLSKVCSDFMSPTSTVTIRLENDVDEKDQEDRTCKFIPELKEHSDDDYTNVFVRNLNKPINSTSIDLCNNNNNELEVIKTVLKETHSTIARNCNSPQKFEEIPNGVQINQTSLTFPIISTTNIETQSTTSPKKTINNGEIVKNIENGVVTTENIVEVNNILQHCSPNLNQLDKINSSEKIEHEANRVFNKKTTYITETLKLCKVNIVREDLHEKLNQMRATRREKNNGDLSTVHISFKNKAITAKSDTLNEEIKDKPPIREIEHFSKKRKCEVNVKAVNKTDMKRPKVNIISDTIVVSGNKNVSLKKRRMNNCRKLMCNVNDLSYLKQWNLQKEENESRSNLNEINTTGHNNTENAVSISEVPNLNQSSNLQKYKTIVHKERQSYTEKEKHRRKFDDFLNDLLNNAPETPELSTPYWYKSNKIKKVPAHKQPRKTRGKTKQADYSEEIKIVDKKVNRAGTFRRNTEKIKKMKQNINVEENFSATSNYLNYTDQIDRGKGMDMEAIKSWILADSAEDEIFDRIENVLKFTTDITEEALEALKGIIPPHRKALYDLIYLINTNLENYFEKCKTGESNDADVDVTNFHGNI